MPIYEYVCADCDHHLEELQRVSDKPLTVCPACGAPKLERVISQTSFQLKGGGWYSDLYSSTPKKGGGGGSGSDGGGKTAGPSESGSKSAVSAA